MAELLYKLGNFSARKPWLVIITWLLILGASASAMVFSGGKLSTAMSIPGTPAQQVIDDLKVSFPAASRGSASVVFHAENGAFTSDQILAIQSELAQASSLKNVFEVTDPFDVQNQIDEQVANLKQGQLDYVSGKQKLEDARAKLRDGQAQLDAAQAKVTANLATAKAGLAKAEDGKKQAKAGLAQATAGKAQAQAAYDQAAQNGATEEQLAAIQAQIDAAQAGIDQATAGIDQAQAGIDQAKAGIVQLNAAQKTIDDKQAQLTAGKVALKEAVDKLPAAEQQLYQGERILTAATEFRVVSSDNSVAQANVVFKLPMNDIEAIDKLAVATFLQQNAPAGVTVELSKDLTQSMEGILGIGEIVGLVVAALVLLIMLGTLIAAGLPVFAAILGVGIGATITMAMAAVIDMSSTTPTLGVMLGLAVGIDYSLFILNRHRKQLKAGMPIRESISLANGTSGNAVFFAGLTVIIALVALNLTGVGFLGLMGDFAALNILVGVLIAVSFMPAVLSKLGLRVLTKKERAKIGQATESAAADIKPAVASKPKTYFAAKHPWLSMLGATIVLLVAALPIGSMRLGLPDGSAEPTDSSQYRAYQLTTDAFGAGSNGVVIVVATFDHAIVGDDALVAKADLATELFAIKNVASVVPAATSEDSTKLLLQVTPKTGPATAETETLVQDLRALSSTTQSKYGATLGVTGLTASNIDVSKKLADALPLYLGTVLALSLLILVLVFRSLLVPLVASFGFLLSVAATMGAVVAVYQWGWLGSIFGVHDPAPVLSFLPTMLIGILFGLAMDYQLFLVSGMREAYVHGLSPKDAVIAGARSGRSVVIAAASIMIFVFGGFAFSHLTQVRPIGLGLAVGVLADAFLVRMTLVPAIMAVLGKSAWYLPKWLDRILPDVDVEGAKLERTHHVEH